MEQPFALFEEGEHQMFAVNLLVRIALRDRLGVLERLLGLYGKSIKLHDV